jgi:hypothetical protein
MMEGSMNLGGLLYDWDHQHEPDQWDCLYCKLSTRCSYGQAVVELRDFCRLQELCPIKEPVEYGEIVSWEIETCLLEIYGHDELLTTNELAVYMRIHMR